MHVQLEDLQDLDASFLRACEHSVAFLPEELAGSEEGLGLLELPAHDVAPLVELEREIAVRLNPLGK